jgi:hypothetical protein
VKDLSNNISYCNFTITVIDNTIPSFTVPVAVTIYTDPLCNANRLPAITGNVVVKSDNCTPSANLIVSYTDSPNIPGSCLGTYTFTRTWKVTDQYGNFATKTQPITVSDNIKPVLVVPANIVISCSNSLLPSFTGQAVATDNCGGPVAITYTDITIPGSCPGNYVVTRTWRATDCSGNFITNTQTITVTDNLPPVATVSNLTVACPSNIPEPNVAVVTATDNCGTPTVVFFEEIAYGLQGSPGYCPTSVVRTYRVTDECGNSMDVMQTITVQAPCGCSPCTPGTNFHMVDMLGQPNAVVTVTDGRNGLCCDATNPMRCIAFNVRLDDDAVGIEVTINGATPTVKEWKIDCGPYNMENGIVCIPGGVFHLFTFCKQGSNINDFTFRSIAGVVSSNSINSRVDCSGQLQVSGIVTSPLWTSVFPGDPGDFDQYLSCKDCINPMFTPDSLAPPVIRYKVCGNIGSTACNSAGTDCDTITVNVYNKIDLQWNVNPTIVCENNMPTLIPNISPAGATYTYEWHYGYDALGEVISTDPSFVPDTAGQYSVKITDTQVGVPCSTVIFNFDVIIDVSGASVFSPPSGNLIINCNDPNASTLIQNWLATATALDEISNSIPVSNNYLGITMACGNTQAVIFSANDHCGNIGSDTAYIFIIDSIHPTWTSVAGSLNRSVSCSNSLDLINAQALAPIATDNCDETITPNKTPGNFIEGNCPNAGSYTNTWIATDACGNASVAFTQVITVTDDTPPEIVTQAQDLTVQCDGAGNVSILNTWLASHAGSIASDNCGSTGWTNNFTTLSDLCGATGTATVAFLASDECGNSISTSATFTIIDTINPLLTCPADVNGTANTGSCYANNVNLGTPIGSDLCSNVLFTNNAPAQFPVGNNIVIWTATDACGNSATCTQNVVIADTQLPTITCPVSVSAIATAPLCEVPAIIVGNPAYSDNCPNPQLTWIKTGATVGSGVGLVNNTVFHVGLTLVTYTVTDASGNTAACSFSVRVNDQVPPTIISCPPATINASAD